MSTPPSLSGQLYGCRFTVGLDGDRVAGGGATGLFGDPKYLGERGSFGTPLQLWL
jgi:hypothetical protein